MLDLNALPARYLAQYGPEKVAEICNTTTSLMGMWQKRGKFPLDAVQKLLEFDPAPLHEIKPLYENPGVPPKLVILVPTTGPVDARTMECLASLIEPGVSLITNSFWSVDHNRNILAARFLASGADYALWCDADMILPAGNAKQFKRLSDAPYFPDVFAGINTIHRLLHHKKTLIGVAYRGRKRGASYQFGGANSIEIKQMMKRGPQQRIMEREWVGFGGMLMHRSVLDDIRKTQGDEIKVTNEAMADRLGYTHAYFACGDTTNTAGDDIMVERRAKKAGHPVFVDLSLFASHCSGLALNYGDA